MNVKLEPTSSCNVDMDVSIIFTNEDYVRVNNVSVDGQYINATSITKTDQKVVLKVNI